MWRAPAIQSEEANAELWGMAALGLCWRGPDRPADGRKPNNVYPYGEAVMDELLKRGATFAELDHARDAAIVCITSAITKEAPSPAAVDEVADFSEPQAADSGTTS
jgi:hypothetical protein